MKTTDLRVDPEGRTPDQSLNQVNGSTQNIVRHSGTPPPATGHPSAPGTSEPDAMKVGVGGVAFSLIVVVAAVIVVFRDNPSLLGVAISLLAVVPAVCFGIGSWLLFSTFRQALVGLVARRRGPAKNAPAVH